MSRTTFTRPALAGLAAACTLAPTAVAVPAVAAAQAAEVDALEPALVRGCTTDALSLEEVRSGIRSEVDCEWVKPGEWVSTLNRSTILAIHYDGLSGAGDYLTVTGSCGSSISFGAGDPWNNVISSTQHRACGVIKHFDTANMGGDTLVTTGALGMLLSLLGMSNRTSSVSYAP